MNTTWTTDSIYKDPDCGYTTTPPSDWFRANLNLFTDEFVAAARSEKSPIVEPVPTIPEADQRAVGLRMVECPVCHDTGTASQRITGGTTGIIVTRSLACSCRDLHLFWPIWNLVDRRWKEGSLENLAPSHLSKSPVAEQVLNIAAIKTHPTSSFILSGASTVGKTYLTYCLYRGRLEEWAAHPHAANGQSVWMLSANEYLNSVSKHAQDPSSRAPVLTPELIRKRSNQGLPVAIFLDEVDKFSPTEARINTLFELVNTAYACKAQIVMTTNASIATLVDKWGAADKGSADKGLHLLRRVGAAPDGFELTFTSDQKAGQ